MILKKKKNIEDWILVKFETKKTIKHLAGKILSFNKEDKPVVKFTRRKILLKNMQTVFIFPVIDDISDVLNEDIICTLPQPTILRRGEIRFNFNIQQFNIQ
jgi:hypothetical protein